MFLFFFLSDKKPVKNAFIKLFPSEMREKTENILSTIAKKLGGYVIAQVFVSGSVWLTLTIGDNIQNLLMEQQSKMGKYKENLRTRN